MEEQMGVAVQIRAGLLAVGTNHDLAVGHTADEPRRQRRGQEAHILLGESIRVVHQYKFHLVIVRELLTLFKAYSKDGTDDIHSFFKERRGASVGVKQSDHPQKPTMGDAVILDPAFPKVRKREISILILEQEIVATQKGNFPVIARELIILVNVDKAGQGHEIHGGLDGGLTGHGGGDGILELLQGGLDPALFGEERGELRVGKIIAEGLGALSNIFLVKLGGIVAVCGGEQDNFPIGLLGGGLGQKGVEEGLFL